MAELRQERDRLQQQLDDQRTELLAIATAPASTASKVRETAKEWKVLADRLNADAIQIREERGELRDQVKQLQATNQRQTDDLAQANFTVDVCRDQPEKLKQTAQSAGPMSQAPATPSGSRLSTHQEMGGHVRLPTASDSSLVLAATPDGKTVQPTLTPMRNITPGPRSIGTTTLPRLKPQSSASLAAPPRQEPEEEDMYSEPQDGPESQQ